MPFELDVTQPQSGETRSLELEHCVEDAIRNYWHDHPELSRQDVLEAIRLVEEHTDTALDLDHDRSGLSMLEDDFPIRCQLSPVFVALAVIAAVAFSVLFVRSP